MVVCALLEILVFLRGYGVWVVVVPFGVVDKCLDLSTGLFFVVSVFFMFAYYFWMCSVSCVLF